MRKDIPFLLGAVLWSVIILLLSTIGVNINLPASLWDIVGWDKLVHGFIYAVLCFLLVRVFLAKSKSLKQALLYAVLTSIVYGILMEIIQFAFFPNRYFEIFDIFANVLGAMSVYIFYLRQNKIIKE